MVKVIGKAPEGVEELLKRLDALFYSMDFKPAELVFDANERVAHVRLSISSTDIELEGMTLSEFENTVVAFTRYAIFNEALNWKDLPEYNDELEKLKNE